MNAIESWVTAVAAQPRLHAILHSIYTFLLPPFLRPRVRAPHQLLPIFAFHNVERVIQSYVWFLLMGLVVYAALTLSKKVREHNYAYVLLGRQPGKTFSLREAFKYLLPKSLYTHRSVKVDLMYWPFSTILNFFGLLSATVGVGVVQVWLLHRLGPSPLHVASGVFAIVLEVVIVLVARDFSRFLWHWQGHAIPFFWEFHKGHHSVEVLHPFFIRTHPVDMFIRNSYMGVGPGLIGGTLIYLLGMKVSAVALGWIASFTAVMDMIAWFEHSHLRISFGKTIERWFYAPYMHHIHHSAVTKHMNKNLGITGGLILWDYLIGTLYRPQPGEQIIWGASMEELGENNPHRTLWGFISGPFIAAVQSLRRRDPIGVNQPVPVTSARAGATT